MLIHSFHDFICSFRLWAPTIATKRKRNSHLPLSKKTHNAHLLLNTHALALVLIFFTVKNMSTTMSSLSDPLPSTVLLLDAEGRNWAIFYICFMDVIKAKGFWEHFDGSLTSPVLSETPTAAETATKNQWDKNE